jgi:hypothetical protein
VRHHERLKILVRRRRFLPGDIDVAAQQTQRRDATRYPAQEAMLAAGQQRRELRSGNA